MNLITFLSDFGTNDGYVGSVKGVILSINPNANVIDISHNIRPYQVAEGAYILNSFFDTYPGGSVHLAVVDPDVGSERLPLIIETTKYLFVGPDNGIFSYIYQREACNIYKIELNKLNKFSQIERNISSTFHARDIFGPVAALLSMGIPADKLGKGCYDKLVSLNKPLIIDRNDIKVDIIWIDHFGNIITNFSVHEYEQIIDREILAIEIKGSIINEIVHSYSSVPEGQLLAIWGSRSFLEISINKGNAAEKLGCIIGKDNIHIKLKI